MQRLIKSYEELIANLNSDDNFLSNGKIINVSIVNDGSLSIIILLKNIKFKGLTFKMIMNDVQEYSLNWDIHFFWGQIEEYKVVKTDDLIYASFDPYIEVDLVSDQDNDYVLFRNVEVQVLSDNYQ